MSRPLFEQLSLFRFTPPPQDAARPRHIQLGPRIVAYRLARRHRRTLGLTIDERGLTVGAPHHSALAEIEAFIRSHAAWVVEKLEEHAGSHARRHLAVRHGARLPVLGAEVEVQVGNGANRAHWGDGVLMLAAKPDADLDALARRALQKRALALFGERLDHYAARLGRPAPALALSSARTRWGSCSSSSGIRLNWRLIHLSLDLIDYVVAHELAHLVEMNHSARFWSEVERIYPDWRRARAELKVRAADLPVI
jgi:predicted metal-dependent hydrolase